MKTVFFVINRLGGKGWGGAHRVLAILANYLANRNYDVKIIVWEKTEIEYPLNENIDIICFDVKIENEMDRFKACYLTRKVLKKHPNSFVYAFISRIAVDVLISSLFLKVKVIGAERTDPKTEPKKKIFRLFRNIMFCFMYKTVFQTYDALNYFPKIAREKGTVIPNPISPNLVKPFNGKRKKEFVTFCRIDKQKNLPLLINAFLKVHDLYPDFSLKIYGNGILEQEIENMIYEKKAADFIKLVGFCSNVHEKIVDSYAYINCSDYEGMSNSMLEALAIGLPSICTDCPIGGAKMIINNMENGILVPVKNEEKLVDAMILLIEDKNLCKKLSSNSILIREKLNEKLICSKWEKLLFDGSDD